MKQKPIILAVDDQPKNIELLEAYLLPFGYEILQAANGDMALKIISETTVDLILLDVMMPGMNGYDVCKKVRVDPKNSFLPIIMLTALDNMDARILGLEAGADDFLNKPFHKIELVARVKNLLKMKFLHDEVDSKNQLISKMLHTYVSENVIEQILSNPVKYSQLGGERRKVAAFFCDIRGFTSLSEYMDADELIQLLNSIYKKLTSIVFKNKGTFDKYMGDCIMAFWGAPIEIEDETLCAINAAIEMQSAFEELKQSWSPRLRELGIGIGINYGDVIVGNVGTEQAMDYTIIGDVVNTAQRIESAAKSGQILITKTAFSRIEGKMKARSMENVQVKGKSLPVEIYEVLGIEN